MEKKMKELKLNVYDIKGKVVKTYKTECLLITTGVVERIFELVDIDKLVNKTTSQEELGKELLKVIVKGWKNFKDVILSMFDGITEEEWKRTRINEVASIIIYILQEALSSLNDIGGNEKN